MGGQGHAFFLLLHQFAQNHYTLSDHFQCLKGIKLCIDISLNISPVSHKREQIMI